MIIHIHGNPSDAIKLRDLAKCLTRHREQLHVSKVETIQPASFADALLDMIYSGNAQAVLVKATIRPHEAANDPIHHDDGDEDDAHRSR